MQRLPVALAPSSARSALLAAYNQWSQADFEGCLEELDRVTTVLGGPELLEARLLRARVYIRLDRAEDALQELNLSSSLSRDAPAIRCSIQSLRGHALSLLGQHDEAMAQLERAVADSQHQPAVSRSVQLEALYMLAFAHWLAAEYDTADAVAVRAIESNGDIITARAVALRGWIAVGRGHYAQSLDFFREALRLHASAFARDAAFAASTLHAVAMYELQLLQHGDKPRYYRGDFPNTGATTLDAFWLLVHDVDAWRAAVAGDEYQAIESSIEMGKLDVSPYWRVFRNATRAMIADAFGHATFGRAFATAAFGEAQKLNWNESPAESRLGLLYVAEALAPYDAARSRGILGAFSAIRCAVSPRFFRGKSTLQRAAEEFSRGVVARASRDDVSARRHFKAAHETYAEMGFLRNAVAAELMLGEQHSAEGKRHYRAARAIIVERFPRSYLARRLKDFTPLATLDSAADLTPAQRHIVGALCAGRSPREIAIYRGTSLGTVYNQIKEIYRRTDLHSIQAIVTKYGRTTA